MDLASDPASYATQLALRVHDIASLPQPEIIRRLRSLIRSLVSPDSIPDSDSRRHLNAIATAAITLEAVGELSRRFYPYGKLRNLVITYVDHLIPWVRHFYATKIRDRLDPIHTNEDKKQKMIRNLSSVLFVMILSDPTAPVIHPKLAPNFDILCGLWFEEDAQHPINMEDIRAPALASETIWMLFGRTTELAGIIEALVHSADEDTDRVAITAVEKLRQAMKAPASKRFSIIRHQVIALILADYPAHAFKGSLKASFQRIEPDLFTVLFAKGIRLLSDQTLVDARQKRPGFTILCSYYLPNIHIRRIVAAENGTRALRQCIRYGVLDGMVELFMQHDGNISESSFDFSTLRDTFAVLHYGLGVRSICVEIQNTFKRLIPYLEMPKSPGRKEWKRFTDAVMVQSVYLNFTTRNFAINGEGLAYCHHVRTPS